MEFQCTDWTGVICKPIGLSRGLGDRLAPELPWDPRSLGEGDQEQEEEREGPLSWPPAVTGHFSRRLFWPMCCLEAWVGPWRPVLPAWSPSWTAPPLALPTARHQARLRAPGGLKHCWAGLRSQETLLGAQSAARASSQKVKERLRGQMALLPGARDPGSAREATGV